MLWFNLYVHARNMHGIIFQYILCCGSTSDFFIFNIFDVQISIHLMLWFNAKEEKPVILLLEFQYILCCGSTGMVQTIINRLKNFNTSYVVVQRM